MKNEDLLHYVWQYQHFDATDLQTDEGRSLRVMKTGLLQTHAGPDFENARILLDGMAWAGKIEIHILASDWEKHGHHRDPAYDAVILHVVWKNDRPVYRHDGTPLPTLSLEGRIPSSLQEKYRDFQNSRKQIPCESLFSGASALSKVSMMEKALAHRLQKKAEEVLQMYASAQNDLEEVAYQLLLKNFGFHLNAEPFLRLARALPHKILARYRGNLSRIEALLFGVGGFLEEPEDEYAKALSSEYRFLCRKHTLSGNALRRADWRFLRTRPHNFPTVRIAQAAAVLNQNDRFFDVCIENQVKWEATVSAYWQKHYDFGRGGPKFKGPGKASLDNLRINTLAPLLSAYHQLTGDGRYFSRAVELLESIPPEDNYIIRLWNGLELKCRSALDSQGLIGQYHEFCTGKNCLKCPVGAELLRP